MATVCVAACVDVPASQVWAVAARGSDGAWPGAGVAPAGGRLARAYGLFVPGRSPGPGLSDKPR